MFEADPWVQIGALSLNVNNKQSFKEIACFYKGIDLIGRQNAAFANDRLPVTVNRQIHSMRPFLPNPPGRALGAMDADPRLPAEGLRSSAIFNVEVMRACAFARPPFADQAAPLLLAPVPGRKLARVNHDQFSGVALAASSSGCGASVATDFGRVCSQRSLAISSGLILRFSHHGISLPA